jgi:nitrate/nitrite transport system permease protein
MAAKERILKGLDLAGLNVFDPVVRLACGDDPKEQLRQITLFIGMPLFAFGLFLLFWTGLAKNIETKFGTLPTPAAVVAEASALLDHHVASRAEERAFYAEQAGKVTALERAAVQLTAALPSAAAAQKLSIESKLAIIEQRIERARSKKFSSSPTYIDQIFTSLSTVFAGFVVASLVAIPVGILCGLSKIFLAAVNPLIQVFKPVSPLAWLPIVMIVVGALYTTDPREAWFEKSFISSALTVALCSLWPTLVNTGLGVASIEKDHMNVAKVLNLGFWTRIRKIVVPSALPLIFAGLRISLGVGWMVLIAAEMLAQNPGLGKFVWDMFQNGSSQTLAQIIVAVFTIGIIGFLLDRVMIILQRSVSYDSTVSA